jgi:hypothetical protein
MKVKLENFVQFADVHLKESNILDFAKHVFQEIVIISKGHETYKIKMKLTITKKHDYLLFFICESYILLSSYQTN